PATARNPVQGASETVQTCSHSHEIATAPHAAAAALVQDPLQPAPDSQDRGTTTPTPSRPVPRRPPPDFAPRTPGDPRSSTRCPRRSPSTCSKGGPSIV